MFKKWRKELKATFFNDTLKFLAWIAILLAALLVASILSKSCIARGAEAPESQSYNVHLKEVRSYIDYFHRNTGARLRKKVEIAKKRIAPAVVEHSINQGIDPLLTSVIISCESSWKPGARGKLQEVGLMQVKDPPYEPVSYIDEIKIGTERLKIAVDTCPDIKAALTHYASGSCKPRTPRTASKMRFRYWMYKKAVKLHRNQ